MKIRSLAYSDARAESWSLDSLPLKDHLNLFVGASGSGKTRVLNILFNIGRFAATGESFANGQWTIHFEHTGIEYTWKYDGDRVGDDRENIVLSEELWIGTPTHVEQSLFVRHDEIFKRGEMPLPKLDKGTTAIHLLREEEAIKPVHEAFSLIRRRSFWGESLQRSVDLRATPARLVKRLERPSRQLSDVFDAGLNLHLTLYFLQKYFLKEYNVVLEQFTRVFPFVSDIRIKPVEEAFVVSDVQMTGDILVATIKERGITEFVPLNEISSGMLKVLLIITDVVSGSPQLLYMIDEYENSLGVNAINFLPSFLKDCGGERQFIITTHHPLLINAIPVSDWFIFHRKGHHIRVMHGAQIVERYGQSKQQRFIQLINDPLYSEGVE